jgi:hypothetical protein
MTSIDGTTAVLLCILTFALGMFAEYWLAHYIGEN